MPFEGDTAPKRKRHSRSQLAPLLEALQKIGDARKEEEARVEQSEARKRWEKAKARRHNDRMERLDRLTDLLAKQRGASGEQ